MELLAPSSSQPLPAPFELIWLLKVLGFSLHMAPMHLWYAGLPLAAAWSWSGSAQGRALSRRLGAAIPIAIALGINFGLVPLLFTQAGYHRVSYAAGILMAWPWLAVIPLLLGAYTATYVHALQAKGGEVRSSGRAALCVAALGLLVVGFLFANHFSLMTHLSGWEAIHERTGVAGAVSGLALNTGDPTLFPRWLMFWGLALTTTATWVAVDAVLLAPEGAADYRAFALRVAAATHGAGLCLFAACGVWYGSAAGLFEALTPTLAAAAAAPLVAGALLVALWRRPGRALAWAVAGAQALALLCNAFARQAVQDAELLAAGFDPAATSVSVEASPLILFVLATVGGLGLLVWLGLSVRADLRGKLAS